jgi:ribose transport system substrate-binding protein
VANAVKAGIPVVIFDSDLKSDRQVSFVATDNYKGGCLAAETMGGLLGGKGNVILLRYAVGSASTEAREAGFLDTLKARFPAIKVVSSEQYAGPTRETAYQAAQNLLNRHGRELDGIFGPNEPTAIGIIKALRDIGKAGGRIKAVGFDAGEQLVSDLNKGDAQALVVQNPMRMGYLGVMTMVKHLRGETVEKRVDTGVKVVTPENKEQPEIRDLLHPPLDKYLN